MAKLKPQAEPKKPAPVVPVKPSRCPGCGSERRAKYHGVSRRPASVKLADGREFDQAVFRYTCCLNCGQVRVDRSLEHSDDPQEIE